jgi:hypothetical protein
MLTIEQARAILKSGLGRAELEFVTSLTAPFYWIVRRSDSKLLVRNGSAFFLDAGEGIFGVTANHVLDGLREDRANYKVVACQLGRELQVDLDQRNRIIDAHAGIDIATFRMSTAEVRSIGKTVLTGHQKAWPPPPPECDKGVYFSGFAGVGTIWFSQDEISFGAVAGGGVASSVSDVDISSLIDGEDLIDLLGSGVPHENFDYRGISGGPMLTVVEHHGLRSWRLAGVIYEGPNPSDDETQAVAGLEMIKARRADFILPDGRLNVDRWNSLQSWSLPWK